MIELVVAMLEQKFQDLTAEEMADILWLALQQSQSAASTVDKTEPAGQDPLQINKGDSLDLENLVPDASSLLVAPPERSTPQVTATAGVTTCFSADNSSHPETTADSASPLAIPDSTALRRSLEILKAIRPLVRLVPSAERTYLDVSATVKAIAETDLWLLKQRPVPEPWLELALVVDATPSMAIWQRTILRLQRVLAQSGAFRDVRTWSLEAQSLASETGYASAREDAQASASLCLRPGFGFATVSQAPRSPQELLDPKGRRLILVVSDCIAPRWDEQPIRDIFQVWGDHGPMGLVQMLPEWMWGRTALGEMTKGQLVASSAGQPSQALRFIRRDRWRRRAALGVTVPVMTLEPAVISCWSQMVSGRPSVSSSGLVFSAATGRQLPVQSVSEARDESDSLAELTAKERTTQFHNFSSPLARRLAGMLAACPEVNLPVIRMVQSAMLPESQQVHVAEVLFGGLFEPQTSITAHTPADRIQYRFYEGVRPLMQETVSPDDAFAALSEWLNNRFGYALEDFQAYLVARGTAEIEPFASVLLDVLRRRGREHTEVIERVEQVYRPRYGSFTELAQSQMIWQDYEIRSRIGTSGVAILTIHGGTLQPGTTEIADTVAGELHSFYSFMSLKPEADQTLYVPSTQFDEPGAMDIIRDADTVLSIHGCEGEAEFVTVGGLDSELVTLVRLALVDAGIALSEDNLGGTHPENICNRGKTGRGVQMQISRGLRDRLIDEMDVLDSLGSFSDFQRCLREALVSEGSATESAYDFPDLADFEFNELHFTDDDFLALSTETFTIRTIERQAPEAAFTQRMESFDITVATLTLNNGECHVQRQQQIARRFIETLSLDKSAQGLVGRTSAIFKDSDTVPLEMVAIPGGSFLMGAPENEVGHDDSELPQREVTVDPFLMGRYSITQAQWRVVTTMPQIERELNPSPSRFRGDRLPVENVSWYDVMEFCVRLSAHTGHQYRLPTEAEWEYACRGGTKTPFHFGDIITTEVANYDGSAYIEGPAGGGRSHTTPIGQFGVDNAFGLSDMHGNVSEWCQDHWHGNYEGASTNGSVWLTGDEAASRISRGGSWMDSPRHCRSACRRTLSPGFRSYYIGFRVSCVAPSTLL